MIINKQTIEEETRGFLKILFSLPEIEKVAIKEVVISSPQDDEHIHKGLDLCYHDRFSDLDLSVVVKVNPIDFYGEMPLYNNFLPRLQLGDKFLGMSFGTRFNLGMHEECLRICLKSGFRMDLVCWIHCDHEALPLPQADRRIRKVNKQEGNLWEDWPLEKVEEFWFTAVHALGKLMRKDYLIADHLSHMLLMEGLVIQMQMRDNLQQTTIHRYGFKDDVAYLDVDIQGAQAFMTLEDEVYNRIAEQIYRAVVSYDLLAARANAAYESCLEAFIEIWKAYIA